MVDAIGVSVVGHFSIDGELKQDYCTSRHHNMIMVSNREELMEKVIL